MKSSPGNAKIWIIIILIVILLGALLIGRQFSNPEINFDIPPDAPLPSEEDREELDRLFGVPEDTPPPSALDLEELDRLYGI